MVLAATLTMMMLIMNWGNASYPCQLANRRLRGVSWTWMRAAHALAQKQVRRPLVLRQVWHLPLYPHSRTGYASGIGGGPACKDQCICDKAKSCFTT